MHKKYTAIIIDEEGNEIETAKLDFIPQINDKFEITNKKVFYFGVVESIEYLINGSVCDENNIPVCNCFRMYLKHN